LRKKSLENP
jgi:AcrR family transcriptional regulator